MRRASIGSVPPVDPAEEVHLDSVLRDPVLELVEELTAAGQAQAPLVQLDRKSNCEQVNLKQPKKHWALWGRLLPPDAPRGSDTSIFQQGKLWVGGPDSPCEREVDNNHTGSEGPTCSSWEKKHKQRFSKNLSSLHSRTESAPVNRSFLYFINTSWGHINHPVSDGHLWALCDN